MPIIRNSEFRAFGVTYYTDEDIAVPYDCNGLVLDSKQFATLVAQIERFYMDTPDEDIREHNKDLREQWKRENKTPTEHHRRRKRGFIYVLGADNGLFKIGQAKSIDDRIKQLAVSLPYELQLICSMATDDTDGLESTLHNKFQEKRQRGEWFELSEADIEYIKELRAQ